MRVNSPAMMADHYMGIGHETGADFAAVLALAETCCRAAGLDPGIAGTGASLDGKAGEEAGGKARRAILDARLPISRRQCWRRKPRGSSIRRRRCFALSAATGLPRSAALAAAGPAGQSDRAEDHGRPASPAPLPGAASGWAIRAA